jgi:hypothetical protein
VPPTAAQVEELGGFSDLHVGSGLNDDGTMPWYNLLRHTQGEWGAILEAGYMEDGSGFPDDSLFCEWAYIINLDDETLEVYQGFQTEKHNKGRFAPRLGDKEPEAAYEGASIYWPVALVATYPLADLPSDEEFITQVDPEEEEGVPDDA